MTDFLLRMDATARILVVGLLYQAFSPQKVIGICAMTPAVRYGGWSSARRKEIFFWCVRLSAKLFTNPCLVHATAFYWMDRDSKLSIGIKAWENSAEAHAWVETPEAVLSTVDIGEYTTLLNFERAL